MDNYKNYSFRDLQLAVKEKGMTADGSRDDLIAKLEGTYVEKPNTVEDRLSRMESIIENLANTITKNTGATTDTETAPVVKEEPKVEEEPVVVEEEEYEEELVAEEEEEERPPLRPVEPKVFRAEHGEAVKKVNVTGGAPEGMLLNDYLVKRGISYNELNNIIKTYANKVENNETVRVTTIDELEQVIQDGMSRAKEVDKSGKSRVEITKDIHLVDALKKLGWTTMDILGSTHIMEKR